MRRALWFAAIVLGASTAHANPFDVLGLTSRRAGQAGTGTASADDASALYYNPAGLVLRPEIELELGSIGAYAHLHDGDKLEDPIGGQIAMRAPLPLRGWMQGRIVVGLALHLLPKDVAHVIAPAPDEGFYPYYGDRMSRLVVMPGAGLRLGRWSVGVAVDFLAGLGGDLSATEGVTRAIDSRVDERIESIARGIVGVDWQATPGLRLGAVFRQRFELPVQTAAKTLVAGEPIDLDIEAKGQFSPHQLVLGAAWTRGRSVISLDAKYARWSDYGGPYVHVDSVLPLVGAVPALEPRVPFDDTFGGKASIETTRGAWTARAGYGFETSPVPEKQTGVTNLLDGNRHTFALGAGRAWGRGTYRLDAHVQMQLVQKRTLDKELFDKSGTYDPFTSLSDEDTMTDGFQSTNPGFQHPLSSGGQVVSGGVTLRVTL